MSRAVPVTSAFEKGIGPIGADAVVLNGALMTMDDDRPAAQALAISSGKIVFVGSDAEARSFVGSKTRVIDAQGHVVSPGFIDIHNHHDLYARSSVSRLCRHFLMQGITTVVGGNCGFSRAGTGPLLDELEDAHPAINSAVLIGHGFVREACGVPTDQVVPSTAQLTAMKDMIEQAMCDGAFGLSTGLDYLPGLSARTEEVIECARVAASHGGLYATHIRSESDALLAAVEEAIRIGREAGIRVEISHLKTYGHCNWWKTSVVLDMIAAARADGVDVAGDHYPYLAFGWNPSAFLTPEDMAAGRHVLLSTCHADPQYRARIKSSIADRLARHYSSRGDLVVIYDWTDGESRRWAGKTLEEILIARGTTPSLDALVELTLEMLPDEPTDSTLGCAEGMSENDVESFLRLPYVAVCTDAFTQPWLSPCHPRSYGAFPRVLGHYVRDRRTISLDSALRKMTVVPALVLGLRDRGLIKEGYWADLTIFDPETIADEATYTKAAPPNGIEYVLVNGTVVVEHAGVNPGDGFVADAIAEESAPGQVLRGPGYARRFASSSGTTHGLSAERGG
jgi:N-acyl-D-amino-acid deacylase